MRIAVRSLKRFLILAGLVAALLAVAIPALADYTGPNRSVSTWSMERRVCDYQAEFDLKPGKPGGYFSCTLTWYETPDSSCPSNSSVADLFNDTACVGWPKNFSCGDGGCDISSLGSSIDSCNDGEPGCRAVEHIVSQPPATVDGTVSCSVPGSGGWCRGDGELSLSGSEPLSGYTILALEGTRNGEPFACSGAACGVPLLEGGNNFTFWAISSWGDTSLMGSASGPLDSGDPALSGSASGTPGDAGWYVSDVTVRASASDAGSGLASLNVRIDGGGWSGYSGPLTLGDGVHTVELRAVDAAGNTSSENLDVDIDTQSPFVDLDAVPSFCPGCGETLDITIVMQDGGSGIAAWSVTASGVSVAGGGSATSSTVAWDGGGLGGGTHTLTLEARDEAGNHSSADFDFALIVPTPAPTDEPTAKPEARSLFGRRANPTATQTPGPGSSATATRAPTSTRTPLTVFFGGAPAVPLGPSSGGPISDPGGPVSSSSSPSANLPASGVVFGAAALALGAVATAIALETARKRKEEEARVRAEMERKNTEAEAAEQAHAAAVAAAKAEAEFELTMGQILNQATGGQGPSDEWLARKEAMLEPRMPPTSTPIDLAKLKQQDYAAGEAWEQARKAAAAAAAYATYRASERASVRIQAPAVEKPWWESALDWVDQHQAAIALGIGVVAGVVVILATAGAATPLVAAGWAALAVAAAATTTAVGTVALNSYYDRPLTDNLTRNVLYSGGAALVTGTAGLAIKLGLATKLLFTVGNTLALTCARFQQACARAEFAMTAFDQLELASIGAQAAFYTIRGEPVPPDLAMELQLEMTDGGVPGNRVLRELGDVAEEAIGRVALSADETAEFTAWISQHHDEARDFIAQFGDEGAAFLARYRDDAVALAALHGPDVVTAFARHGDEGVAVVEDYGVDFVRRSEKLGVDPTEVLNRPPAEGQTLEGWLLGITNRASAVNQPLKFGLSDEAIQAVADGSIHNNESALFVIGFGKGAEIPYDEFARQHGLGYFATNHEAFDMFDRADAWGDFWEIDAAAMERVINDRKIIVLNTSYNEARQATSRLTAAEIRFIERGNYVLATAGSRDFLVPTELLDSYLSIIENLAPELLGG